MIPPMRLLTRALHILAPAGAEGASSHPLLRRLTIAGSLTCAMLLLARSGTALALGGGGVGGFGGGGGGGGGGGFGGGGFVGGGGGGGGGGGSVAGFVFFLLIVLLYALVGASRQWRSARRSEQREPLSWRSLLRAARRVLLWPIDLAIERRRLGRRTERVKLAAAEASEMDPRFASEVVCGDAQTLFCAIQKAWTEDDRDRLGHLVGKDLMSEWERRLSGFALRGWTNEIELCGSVHAAYVGLRNASDDLDKRAVVRITARVRDIVIDRGGNTIHRLNSVKDTHHVCEYWTLGVSGEGWRLMSIEQHREGLHELTEPILPTPWADTSALQREATLEQAAGARIENSQIAEIAGAEIAADARAAALDISLVDDRFAPRVLAAEAEHAVATWAEAIDGDDSSLATMATPVAVQELLYPGDPSCGRRLVVRGPRVRSLHIAALNARDMPPTMVVELKVTGRRYVEDRTTTTVLSGDRSVVISFGLAWRMELTDDDAHPWRIGEVVQPAERDSRLVKLQAAAGDGPT
jgi:predicted lipid-binding transport protein (Tim44 family)